MLISSEMNPKKKKKKLSIVLLSQNLVFERHIYSTNTNTLDKNWLWPNTAKPDYLPYSVSQIIVENSSKDQNVENA